jgi:flagellar hook-associated protein 3
MSSGRRINKPSDDPIGTRRDLSYRTELAKITQYQKNIDQAQTWMTTYDTTLGDLKDLVSSAKEIAVTMANGVYDEVTRNGSAAEVESIFDRLMQLSNQQLEGRYIFSGHRTDNRALQATASGVVYRGDNGAIDYQIETSAQATVNLIGANVFLRPLTPIGEDADLNPGVTGSTLLADLHNGAGIDQSVGTFTITDLNLGLSSTVDITGAATVDDVINAINTQLAADGITTLEAKLGEEGNNLLLDSTANGLVSTATPLSRLNSGNGVDLIPGQIRVTDGAAIDITVDVSDADTLNDVITAFNDEMAAAGYGAVTMRFNAAGTGLQIDDASAVPLNLRVEDVGADQNTAVDLGIAGLIGSSLIGRDLDPQVGFRIEETTGTTAQDLGILAEITGDYAGNDLDPLLLLTTGVDELNHGLGIERGEILIQHGDTYRRINLDDPAILTIQDLLDAFNTSGLNITASINPDGRGIQIENNDPTRSLVIKDDTDGRVAKDLGIWGSGDMMGSVMLLGDSLRADDQEGIGLLLKNMDEAMNHLLEVRASVGASVIRLENTYNRLTTLDLSVTDLLSKVEDADITKLVTDLATYENNYKSSLMASARIIQPSLLDFLG